MKIWYKKGSIFYKFKQHDYTFIKILCVQIRYKTLDKNWYKFKSIKI